MFTSSTSSPRVNIGFFIPTDSYSELSFTAFISLRYIVYGEEGDSHCSLLSQLPAYTVYIAQLYLYEQQQRLAYHRLAQRILIIV